MKRIATVIGLLAATLAAKEALAQSYVPPAPTVVPSVPSDDLRYGRGEGYYGGRGEGYYGGRGEGYYGGGYQDPVQDRQDARTRRYRQDRWTYLAAIDVNGFRDRDVISLGPQAGRYDRLMLVPQGRRVWLRNAVVTFMNGETINVDLRDRNRDAGPIVIDLPGERRAVATVEIAGAAGRWGYGGAQVALYGERVARRWFGWNR